MSDNKNSDFVQEWNKKIESGLEYRSKYSTIREWKAYREYYRGDWGNNVHRPSNRVFSNIKTLIPRTYFRNPAIVVTPRHPRFSASARVLEALDNWLIGELNVKYTIKRGIVDASLCGVGPIKLGFDSEFGYIPSQAVGTNSETLKHISRKTGAEIE